MSSMTTELLLQPQEGQIWSKVSPRTTALLTD